MVSHRSEISTASSLLLARSKKTPEAHKENKAAGLAGFLLLVLAPTFSRRENGGVAQREAASFRFLLHEPSSLHFAIYTLGQPK